MKKLLFLFVALLPLVSCTVGPKPIAYGETGCHFCKMTVVDKQHAAQMVTKKGKIFNFDATECMLNYLKDVDAASIGFLLSNDYNTPGELIDVGEATFLISEGIPSPMGEYLTAFGTLENAKKAQQEHGGELYTWDELKQRFE